MVSFSLSSKAQPALRRSSHSPPAGDDSNNDEGFQNNREYITEFDSSESPTDTSKIPKNLVIPPKPNEWNPQQRHLPQQCNNQAIQFDVDSTSVDVDVDVDVDAAADSVAYGLNLRNNDNNSSLPAAVEPTLQKLREDLARLPDVSDEFEDYEAVPVEGFGRALLAGYGWQEGMGIGLNAREDVKVSVFQGWSGREGLGYTTGVDHPANLHQEVPILPLL